MKIEKFLGSSPAISIVLKGQQLTTLMNRHLEDESLNFLHALILISIFFEANNEIRPKDLPKTFQTTKGNISHCLAHLEGKKFIERKIYPVDGRGFLIALTFKGRAVCSKLIKYFDELQRQTEEMIGEAESLKLVGYLQSIENLFSYYSSSTKNSRY